MGRPGPLRVAIRACLALAVLTAIAAPAWAVPDADPWPYWDAHDPGSAVQVDHDRWDAFLSRHVEAGTDGINRIDYGAIGAAERAPLDRYLDGLSRVPVRTLNRREQKPLWINLYNALTVRVVLDHYPVGSIRDIDISPGLFSNGPWGRKLFAIDGRDISLDDIEHRILRPIWRDPRIHYAVNCAALGCPNLRQTAFTAANMDFLLDSGARDFVNHPRGARIAGGRLTVSSIFVWFRADFGDDDAGVIDHIRRYAAPDPRERLRGITRIDRHDYDWRLNSPR